jgi:DNA adenine methylase
MDDNFPNQLQVRARSARRLLPRPVIKWAGGKTQLLKHLVAHVPPVFGHYWEPFVGSAALFWELRRAGRIRGATLSDVNPELVSLYRVIRDEVELLIARLREHERWRHDRAYYYRVRQWDRDPAWLQGPEVERAARLIFLNKTCYNGLHRVNRHGQFNVPWGRYSDPCVCDAANLRAASAALAGIDLRVGDFKTVLRNVRAGDFVYLDPPYVPRSITSSFTAYSEHPFGIGEHHELAATCTELVERGCFLVLSNSDTPLVRDLYHGFDLRPVHARRAINAQSQGRGAISELIVVPSVREAAAL